MDSGILATFITAHIYFQKWKAQMPSLDRALYGITARLNRSAGSTTAAAVVAAHRLLQTEQQTLHCYQKRFVSETPSRSEIMSSLHLATGAPLPPQDPKVELRIYNMKYCPFAQRALLAAEAKGLSYDIVNCNLKDKPEWLLAKNPEGKVPVLETKDGKILYESLIVADYLDEAYPNLRPLHPTDPYKKAKDRLFLEKFGTVVQLFYKIIFTIKDTDASDAVKQEKIAEFVKGLKPFEDELERRGTTFFGGNDKPGMLDYMIWPWFERVPAIKQKMPDLFDYDAAKTQNPNLEKWRQAMKKDAAVAKILIDPDTHLKFMESFLAGNADYDLKNN